MPLRARITAALPSTKKRLYTMANAHEPRVSISEIGLLGLKQDEKTSRRVSELLQEDAKKHDIYFNSMSFHNHIPHHLLALYDTGANHAAIQRAYDENASYQRSAAQPDQQIVDELLADWGQHGRKYFGNSTSDEGKVRYASILRYFQIQIQEKGWQAVVKDHLLADTDLSHDLCSRLFSGVMHPLIQLMYGLEFDAPLVVAEGLAQAALHDNTLGALLDRADSLSSTNGTRSKTLPELYKDIRNHKDLIGKHTWIEYVRDDGEGGHVDKYLQYVSKVSNDAPDLQEQTAEALHAVAWMVVSTARFSKSGIPNFDFFMLHCLTSSPFLQVLNKQNWLDDKTKARFLAEKIRLDMLVFLSRGAPTLNPDLVKNYVPAEDHRLSDPQELFAKFHELPDDGHVIKMARSLMIARDLSARYHDRRWHVMDESMWLNAMYMLLDSAKAGAHWYR